MRGACSSSAPSPIRPRRPTSSQRTAVGRRPDRPASSSASATSPCSTLPSRAAGELASKRTGLRRAPASTPLAADPSRFETLDQARAVIGSYIDGYHHRPHSGLAYRTPREVAATWKDHDDQLTPAA